MIVLNIMIILAVLIGWRIRYNNSQLGWCKFNIYDENPNLDSILLYLGTVYSLMAIFYYAFKILNQ